MLGHSLRSLEHIYTRLSEDEIYKECSKAINLLTIDPANRLKKQVQDLTGEKDQVSELKNKIKLLEDAIDDGNVFIKTQDARLVDLDRRLKGIVKVMKKTR